MKYVRAILYFAVTLAMYLGISLFGWGLDDLSGFFAFTPRAAYALVVVAFALAISLQAIDSPEGIDGGKGDESKRVRRQTFVAAVMMAILFGSLIFLPFADRRAIGVLADDQVLR